MNKQMLTIKIPLLTETKTGLRAWKWTPGKPNHVTAQWRRGSDVSSQR